MPLDRTWFNNLVDDDGSGTLGTPWNKAQIKNDLDSVDACFSAFADYTPAFIGVSTGGSTITIPAGSGNFRWRRWNTKIVEIRFAIEGASINGVAAASVIFYAPTGMNARPWGNTGSVPTVSIGAGYIGGHEPLVVSLNGGDYQINLSRMGTQTFPVSGGQYYRGSLVYEIA